MDRTQEYEPNPNSSRNQQDSHLTEKWASSAHDTVDRVADTARNAEHEVREGVSKLAESAKHSEAKARQTVDQSIAQASAYVRGNPLVSAGIAFAAGIVLSSLLRR